MRIDARNGVSPRGPIRRHSCRPKLERDAQKVYRIATLPSHAIGGRVPYKRSKFWKAEASKFNR